MVDAGIKKAEEVYTSAKTYVEKKAAEVHEEVKKAMCTTTNYVKEQLGKVDWESVGKVVAGGAIIVGLGVATVCTGGLVGAVAAGAFAGATISGGVGYGLSTGVGMLNNPLVRETAESVAETAIGAMDTLAHGGTVTAKDLAQDFALNMIMEGGGASKADDLVEVATSKQNRDALSRESRKFLIDKVKSIRNTYWEEIYE